MFNQKVNHYTHDNPSYLNNAIGAPTVHPEVIHNCGTTINKYKLAEFCGSLPLQTWCSKNVAVESFAMRPIVNSKEYFENVKKYLASIILNDAQNLANSRLAEEYYELLNDYGEEPLSSLLDAINLEVTNKINILMANSADSIEMFKNYNPLCEGFVVTDINIYTYRSVNNKNHYYHKITFSAVNTTRYNTVSFKAELYQDTTGMMKNWNRAIQDIKSSVSVPKDINNVNSVVYVYNMGLLNNTMCVVGQEDDCEFNGFNLQNGSYSQLLNDNLLSKPVDNSWLKPNALSNNYYDTNGNYDTNGMIRITDNGPTNLEKLVKDLKSYYS